MIALAISLDKQLLIFKSSYLVGLPSAITLYSRYGPMAFLAQAVEAWVWNGEIERVAARARSVDKHTVTIAIDHLPKGYRQGT